MIKNDLTNPTTLKDDKRSLESMYDKNSLVYVLDGKPVAKARPRISGRRVYNEQKHIQTSAGITLERQHHPRPFYKTPILFDVTFFMYIPISKSKKQQNLLKESFHSSRPDLSNFIKFIEDAALGILYEDDSIISCIYAKKVYSDNPRTEFTITELNDADSPPRYINLQKRLVEHVR